MSLKLKYILYFEGLLMASTVITCTFFPEFFLSQISNETPSLLTIELARWYGIPFITTTYVLVYSLWSKDWIAIKVMLIAFMVTDIVVFFGAFVFAHNMDAWTPTLIFSATTAIIFAVTRYLCWKNPALLGIEGIKGIT